MRQMHGDERRAQIAKMILSARLNRNVLFPSNMFNDHAWIILLTLFVAHAENRILSKSEVIHKLGANVETCTRWIKYLIQSRQVFDIENGKDLILSDETISRLRSLFDDVITEIYGFSK